MFITWINYVNGGGYLEYLQILCLQWHRNDVNGSNQGQ